MSVIFQVEISEAVKTCESEIGGDVWFEDINLSHQHLYSQEMSVITKRMSTDRKEIPAKNRPRAFQLLRTQGK